MDKNFILLDLDGTVTDPKAGITKSVQYSLKPFGINVENPDELVTFIGPPLRESYKKYYGFSDDETEIAVAKYREYYSEHGIFENALYPGMSELLSSLRRHGKTLLLATSKPTFYAKQILEHFEIAQYFGFIAGSEMDGERSLKKEIIEYAIENMQITELSEAVMIGDRDLDIIGAAANGIDSIGVLYGYGSKNELSGATYIAKDITKLSELLV